MFWDNLKAACDKQNIKVTPLLTELKISSGSIGKWQKGGNVSSETLLKLSERLGVSIDYLIKGEEPVTQTIDALQSVSYDEMQILTWFRALPQQGKSLCMNYIKGAYDMHMATIEVQSAG